MRPMILFDMDGTILDSIAGIGTCCNKALAEFDLPQYPIPEYDRMVGWGMKRLIINACPADATDELRDAVRARYDAIYTEYCHQKGTMYPGIEELLRSLRARGVLTAVLTNKPHQQATPLFHSTFEGLLDEVWGQQEGKPLKPDPAQAIALAESLDAKLIAYVGDSAVDLQMGAALGVPTIGVTWGSRTREELLAAGTDAILVDTVAELTEQLEALL